MSFSKNSDFENFCETLFSGQVAPASNAQLRREEHKSIVEKWRKTFAFKLRAETGEWRVGGYDWHVFTFGYARALVGKRAIDNYNRLAIDGSEGYIFTHTTKNPFACFTNRVPSYLAIEHTLTLFKELADIYVVDQYFKWTFVVTHENSSGIGPFFGRVG